MVKCTDVIAMIILLLHDSGMDLPFLKKSTQWFSIWLSKIASLHWKSKRFIHLKILEKENGQHLANKRNTYMVTSLNKNHLGTQT